PGAGPHHDRLRPVVHGHRSVAALYHHDRPGFYSGRTDHYPDWRGRHAGRGVHAEQLFGLGGGRYWLLAQQLHAHHRRFAGGLLGGHFVVHHVQGHEPLVLQRDPGWLWGRALGRGGERRWR